MHRCFSGDLEMAFRCLKHFLIMANNLIAEIFMNKTTNQPQDQQKTIKPEDLPLDDEELAKATGGTRFALAGALERNSSGAGNRQGTGPGTDIPHYGTGDENI